MTNFGIGTLAPPFRFQSSPTQVTLFVFPDFDLNRSMIFNPLIVVASELGISRAPAAPHSKAAGERQIVRAFNRVNESGIGSVIVDSVNDEEAAAAVAGGAYTVRTDLAEFGRTHNYRSNSGAERIAATVNRFDRYYTHDVVVAVPDDMPELRSFYLQALMYALASSEVGIATLVSPLKEGELEDYGVVKASVDWNSDRVVYPIEGGRVGTLRDIRRDATALGTDDVYKFVPIHAWRRGALDRLVNTPPSERELDEGTDLVRALDAGVRIDVCLVWEDMKVLIKPEEVRGDEIEG
jgi:3-deoxy-manno-octulosonate cytidylyltransferase (CMP-KDO synthetase)